VSRGQPNGFPRPYSRFPRPDHILIIYTQNDAKNQDGCEKLQSRSWQEAVIEAVSQSVSQINLVMVISDLSFFVSNHGE
jgi:16S rRNA U1498 N3-methylase RsmE